MTSAAPNPSADNSPAGDAFGSGLIERLRQADPPDQWLLPDGCIRLPRVFGFCSGVKRALAMAIRAIAEHGQHAGRLVLLGEIIHNPWVNDYFRRLGVIVLSRAERQNLTEYIQPGDCAIIPAFGVPLEIHEHLEQIGCRVIDCSCGDVIRLWRWSENAVTEGFGVLVFGRSMHDETVVTKSRLAAAGGRFLVAETLEEVRAVAEAIRTGRENDADWLPEYFTSHATNAKTLQPLLRMAQVSQTTMLYDQTIEAQKMLRQAFEARFGPGEADRRLRFQPTVCRATQQRQNAAVELCQSGCDVILVIGGFGSSNTRHLYELAGRYAPAYLIEDAAAIESPEILHAFAPQREQAETVHDWLPQTRPITVGVLAGASSPEIVVGEVMQKLAGYLGGQG